MGSFVSGPFVSKPGLVHDSLEIRKWLHVTGESRTSIPSLTLIVVSFDQTVFHKLCQSPFELVCSVEHDSSYNSLIKACGGD